MELPSDVIGIGSNSSLCFTCLRGLCSLGGGACGC
jgi:hypothetical protein